MMADDSKKNKSLEKKIATLEGLVRTLREDVQSLKTDQSKFLTDGVQVKISADHKLHAKVWQISTKVPEPKPGEEPKPDRSPVLGHTNPDKGSLWTLDRERVEKGKKLKGKANRVKT